MKALEEKMGQVCDNDEKLGMFRNAPELYLFLSIPSGQQEITLLSACINLDFLRYMLKVIPASSHWIRKGTLILSFFV